MRGEPKEEELHVYCQNGPCSRLSMSLLGNVRSRNLARACRLFVLVLEVADDPWSGPSFPQKVVPKNKLRRTNSARTHFIFLFFKNRSIANYENGLLYIWQ